VSFGLPDRVTLNAGFLNMAIACGLTSAITNPLEDPIRKAIYVADVMMGVDENCAAWLAAHRGGGAGADERAARRRRRQESGGA
jgi:5-methyltetrahydrofolate--homocysteine methyltransferase